MAFFFGPDPAFKPPKKRLEPIQPRALCLHHDRRPGGRLPPPQPHSHRPDTPAAVAARSCPSRPTARGRDPAAPPGLIGLF